jgi:signal peptidase II
MKLWLAIVIPLYLLDQITKRLVLRYIGLDDVIVVIPDRFNLIQAHNTGAAFSMLSGNNHFFIGLASIAFIVLVVLTWRGSFKDKPSWVASALLASGIIGNLTDRILYGHVIDFLDVILPWYGHWPTFNVADSCIFIAAFLFVIAAFRGEAQPKSA